MATAWRNRIVGYGQANPEELCANPRNWRIHPAAQQAALLGALSELGWLQDVIVNKRTGYVVDGHARIALALRHGQTDVPVKYVDLSDAEEALALATLDPLAAMAGADAEQLATLMDEISTGEAAVQAMLADLAAKEGVAPPDFEPVGIDEQGRLDEKARVTCPECGHTFTP